MRAPLDPGRAALAPARRRRPNLRWGRTSAALAAVALSAGQSALAEEVPEAYAAEGLTETLQPRTDAGFALKASTLAPEGSAAANLWRARLELEARVAPEARLQLAYEHRARSSPAGSGGLSVLPADAPASYRLAQLDEALIDEPGYSHRHELDRAFFAARLGRANLTVGRQAIGWGRGVLFSAVDVFSPFMPLEVDREWRRGVDALRADVGLSDTYSLDTVLALGEDWEGSALLARLRGYSGDADVELVLGKRAEDLVLAGTFSAALGGAELHGELAVFDTPEVFPGGGLFGSDGHVAKAVAGASFTFDVGRGLTVCAEYHFSGFGSADMEEALARLADPAYAARLARGDTQILCREAFAVRAACPLGDELSASLSVVTNPRDGSGCLAPGLVWTFSDDLTVSASAFFPWGAGPDSSGYPRSEYGGSRACVFLQMSLYR